MTVFDPKTLRTLAQDHLDTFRQLADIETRLSQRFYRLGDAVLGLILSIAAGESLLLVGPPGTGKSRLVRDFCEYLGIDPAPASAEQRHGGYFEYLLTPFTEPGELFGFYDIKTAREEGRFQRLDTGMMQHARVVYLDEVFNGSSAILNSLLAFMNEGRFHDRGAVVDVAVQCVFGATNSVPRSPELKAIFDRFLLRVFVENSDPREIGDLIGAAWGETYAAPDARAYPDLLDGVRALQAAITEATQSGQLVPRTTAPFYTRLGQIVLTCRQYGYSEMSNRRLVKMLHVMVIHALYDAAKRGDMADIQLGAPQLGLLRYAVDRQDDFLGDLLAADRERAG